MKKIVFCGGGTAGHVIPNIALFPYLKDYQIYYIGSKNGIEKTLISKFKNIKYYEIDCVKFNRSFDIKNMLIPFKLIKGINQSKKILKQIKPDIVFSKGGYVSLPTVIAARSLKTPIIAHESDISMGLSNKLILKYCTKMCTSFEYNSKNKKIVHTYSPIRQDIAKGSKNYIKNNYNINLNNPTILIVGGSMGAKAINDFVIKNISVLTKKYNIVHITGHKHYDKNLKHQNYIQLPYVDNISDYLHSADIVISRSGSNMIFELLYLKKLMILIPLPKDNSRGDQILNAKYFVQHNFGSMIEQNDLNIKILLNTIEHMLKNKNYYTQSMQSVKSNGNTEIVKIINSNVK